MTKYVCLFLLLASTVHALQTSPVDSQLPKEVFYAKQWCTDHGGQHEFVFSEMTRVDCLTEDEAIEVDWAYKWYEAIGQSLYYSMLTGKKASMALIVLEGSDEKYIERASRTVMHHNIPVRIYIILKQK